MSYDPSCLALSLARVTLPEFGVVDLTRHADFAAASAGPWHAADVANGWSPEIATLASNVRTTSRTVFLGERGLAVGPHAHPSDVAADPSLGLWTRWFTSKRKRLRSNTLASHLGIANLSTTIYTGDPLDFTKRVMAAGDLQFDHWHLLRSVEEVTRTVKFGTVDTDECNWARSAPPDETRISVYLGGFGRGQDEGPGRCARLTFAREGFFAGFVYLHLWPANNFYSDERYFSPAGSEQSWYRMLETMAGWNADDWYVRFQVLRSPAESGRFYAESAIPVSTAYDEQASAVSGLEGPDRFLGIAPDVRFLKGIKVVGGPDFVSSWLVRCAELAMPSVDELPYARFVFQGLERYAMTYNGSTLITLAKHDDTDAVSLDPEYETFLADKVVKSVWCKRPVVASENPWVQTRLYEEAKAADVDLSNEVMFEAGDDAPAVTFSQVGSRLKGKSWNTGHFLTTTVQSTIEPKFIRLVAGSPFYKFETADTADGPWVPQSDIVELVGLMFDDATLSSTVSGKDCRAELLKQAGVESAPRSVQESTSPSKLDFDEAYQFRHATWFDQLDARTRAAQVMVQYGRDRRSLAEFMLAAITYGKLYRKRLGVVAG